MNHLIAMLLPIFFFMIILTGCKSDVEKTTQKQDNSAGKSQVVKGKIPENSNPLTDNLNSEIPVNFTRIPTQPIQSNPGDFHLLWGPLLNIKEVYAPSFDEFPAMSPDTVRPVKASEVIKKSLYVEYEINGTPQLFNVLYTDIRLFTSTQMLRKLAPVKYLEEVLFDTNSVGVAINSPSRIMRRDVGDVTNITKTGIAELIGFLETGGNEPEGIPYSQLSIDSFNKNKPYQALYYWMKSYRTPRPDDNWKQAESAKLKSYWDLNFPGARERALGELNWFINTHGATPELEFLSGSWTNK